jgi:carbon-monoxide dehydrogenase medium subunit/xanthine dehydrogenase FAD-binding subunit
MIHSFQVIRPRSLKEALEFLSERRTTWRIIAGGTDLMLFLRNSQLNDPLLEGLVDISDLEELRGFETTTTTFCMGAMSTFADLSLSPIVSQEAPLLAEMARWMGSTQIRNRATIGGNLVNAATCADSVPPLLVLSAQVSLSSIRGVRILPIDEFILEPGRTAIRPEEILTSVSFDRIPEDTSWGYVKLGRRKSASISRVSVAAIRFKSETSDSAVRLAAGAVTPLPSRLRKAEQSLLRNGWTSASMLQAATAARNEVASIAGNRWSSDYKLPVLENLVRQTLNKLI